uniref:Rab-GAP TBC domain-containing protein n=1 Tax=Macrostomum lignano TaxID=282301 RepID=A0A1I8FL73_9PLAT
ITATAATDSPTEIAGGGCGADPLADILNSTAQSAEFEQKLAAAEYAAAQAEEAATAAASKANEKLAKEPPPRRTWSPNLPPKLIAEKLPNASWPSADGSSGDLEGLSGPISHLGGGCSPGPGKYKQRCTTQNQRLDEQAKQLSEQQVANEKLTDTVAELRQHLGTVEDTTIVGECWLTGRLSWPRSKLSWSDVGLTAQNRLAEKGGCAQLCARRDIGIATGSGKIATPIAGLHGGETEPKANRLDQLTDAGWRRAPTTLARETGSAVDDQLADGREPDLGLLFCLAALLRTVSQVAKQCESADEIEDQHQQQQQQQGRRSGWNCRCFSRDGASSSFCGGGWNAARRAVAARYADQLSGQLQRLLPTNPYRYLKIVHSKLNSNRMSIPIGHNVELKASVASLIEFVHDSLHRDDLGDTGDSAGQQNDFWALVTPEIAQSREWGFTELTELLCQPFYLDNIPSLRPHRDLLKLLAHWSVPLVYPTDAETRQDVAIVTARKLARLWTVGLHPGGAPAHQSRVATVLTQFHLSRTDRRSTK